MRCPEELWKRSRDFQGSGIGNGDDIEEAVERIRLWCYLETSSEVSPIRDRDVVATGKLDRTHSLNVQPRPEGPLLQETMQGADEVGAGSQQPGQGACRARRERTDADAALVDKIPGGSV